MKKPFGDSSEQLKERLGRIVQKPTFFLAAEIALLVSVVLIAGFLLVGALQKPGGESQPQQPERAQVEKVEITAMPYRCIYISGQRPDTAGMELTLTYADGTVKKVTEGFTCSPEKLEDYGKQQITVGWDDKTDVFDVLVVEPVSSGSCGEDLLWAITANGDLIISGSGRMQDFGEKGAPWNNLTTKVKTIYLQEGLPNIGNYAFSGCEEVTGIRIPESVSSIGKNAFAGCLKLQSCQLPEKVKDIEQQTFLNCTELKQVMLPKGLTYIGQGAFQKCKKLQSIALPESLTTIAAEAFRESGLEQITIPEGVVKISSGMFRDCGGLKKVVLPKSVTAIENYAFQNCVSLTDFEIPAKVSKVDSSIFSWCGVRKFTVDPQNPYFETDEYGVLYTKGLKTLVLYPCARSGSYAVAQGCTTIKLRAFIDCCGLKSITFSDTLECIERSAFYNCSELVRVTIPASVQTLEDGSFVMCSGLTAFYVMNPQCVIAIDIVSTLKKITLYGYEGSTLQQYAQQQGYRFSALQV